jgi:hypothetical protein
MQWCPASLELDMEARASRRIPARYCVALVLNAVLGAWLCTSAFLWVHSAAQFSSATLCNSSVLAVAIFALTLILRTVSRRKCGRGRAAASRAPQVVSSRDGRALHVAQRVW